MRASPTRLAPILLLLGLAAAPAAAGGSGWLKNPEDALKRARKAGKPVLVEFGRSDTCAKCRALNKEVFWTSKFRSWARKHPLR